VLCTTNRSEERAMLHYAELMRCLPQVVVIIACEPRDASRMHVYAKK
jgi:hypothetical protein